MDDGATTKEDQPGVDRDLRQTRRIARDAVRS